MADDEDGGSGTTSLLLKVLVTVMVILLVIMFSIYFRDMAPKGNFSNSIPNVPDPDGISPYGVFILPLGAIFKYSRGKKYIARGGL